MTTKQVLGFTPARDITARSVQCPLRHLATKNALSWIGEVEEY
jgi:hypothetical protein